jgi:hypothetical protein
MFFHWCQMDDRMMHWFNDYAVYIYIYICLHICIYMHYILSLFQYRFTCACACTVCVPLSSSLCSQNIPSPTLGVRIEHCNKQK